MRTKNPDVGDVSGEPRLPILPCACANLRRAARAVTQLYDQELRGAGLGVAQFTLLHALLKTGEISQGALGSALSMDSTTLTRTLGHLRRAGWITVRAGTDRRVRLVSLTVAGRRQFERSHPHWQRAQDRLRRMLGDERWEVLGELSHKVVRSARKA
jgi:DNA-binding MarR family transcriptional regulator